MHADDFRGVENELLLCEGARILLTQNLWVEAGLMNGALGVVRQPDRGLHLVQVCSGSADVA